MRQLAVEVAQQGIRVNAVCPGPVVTPMTDNLKRRDPDLYEDFFGRCILGGHTMPEDVADCIAYVAQARRMTGQAIVIDGGYSCW
jgi:NAD(P)-dependent dehydrogenase (short-subunit alcohol dehydrogenase family)